MFKKLAALVLFCFSSVAAASDICLPAATHMATHTATPVPACSGAYAADDPRWRDDSLANDPNTCHCEDSCDGAMEWFVGWNKARCLAGLPFDQQLISAQCEDKQSASPQQQPLQQQSQIQTASVAVCSGFYDGGDPRWWDDSLANDPNACYCESNCEDEADWLVGWHIARCRAGLQFDRDKVPYDQCQNPAPSSPGPQQPSSQKASLDQEESNRRPPGKPEPPGKKTPPPQTSCSCEPEYEGLPLYAVRSHVTSSGGLYCDCCYGEDGHLGYVYVIE
ncbi:MAG: hypothetical protein OXI34_02895 [Chloroflexota bacterium]|nr:hypothetical protein [Chloroflexota bacterium]MDE2947853.1 hypothetical protein [Chloroflexota bacterium]